MIYAVRHAEVSAKGLCYGQSDVPVLVAHEVAAERVQASLVAIGAAPVAIVASPWERTLGLAEALAKRLGIREVRTDARLSELGFGEWEGRLWSDLERDDGSRLAVWMAHYLEERPPGGETVGELERRLDGFLADSGDWKGDVLVVTHAGVVRTLRRKANGASVDTEMAIPVAHLEVNAFRFR